MHTVLVIMDVSYGRYQIAEMGQITFGLISNQNHKSLAEK